MMKIPTVKSCCCFDIRFGTLVIACLELAYSVVGLVDGIRLASVTASSPSTASASASSVTTSPIPDGGEHHFILRDRSMMKKLSRMYFWFHLAELVGVLIIASLLVHGVRTRRRTLFVPWLGIHFLTTVIFAALVLVVPVGVLVEFGDRMAGAAVTAGLGCLVAFIINAYVSIVVYSHYKEIGDEARARRAVASAVVVERPVEVEVYVHDQLPPPYEEIVKNKDAYPPVNP